MAASNEIKAGVQALLALEPDELEAELGKRLDQVANDITEGRSLTAASATGPTVDQAMLQSISGFTRSLATRFLDKFNKQMYMLICDATDPEHEKIRSAAAQGMETLGYALGGALVVTFGWLPGIATVIAVIIVKRVQKAGYAAFCETWKENL
jgi:hypothetical protein